MTTLTADDVYYASGRETADRIRSAWDRHGSKGGLPRILESHSGPGRVTIHMARWAGTVTAEDPDLDNRKRLRRRAAAEGLSNVEAVDEGTTVRFDLAVSMTLPDLPYPRAAAALADLARRAGLIAVRLPLYSAPSPGSKWGDAVWTPEMLAVAAGALALEILSISPNEGPFDPAAPGPFHDVPQILRKASSAPRRACCGGRG